MRCFALSSGLLAHLGEYIKSMRPNEKDLLFATRNGTPWDANLLVKRKLYPLLDALGIERGGLHAFRHYLPFLTMSSDTDSNLCKSEYLDENADAVSVSPNIVFSPYRLLRNLRS